MTEIPSLLNADLLQALPEHGSVVMINLVRFHKTSLDGNGSGWDAYVRYSKGDMPLLKKVGATILWSGHVEATAFGALDDAQWDWVVLVQYPSKAAFLEMMTSPEYQVINKDRENGVAAHLILSAKQSYSKLTE